MSPIRNARIVLNEYAQGYPDAEKTLVLDASRNIDIDNVPLNGGILLKILVISIDPYLRNKMVPPTENARAAYKASFELGDVITNYGIGVVVKSENPTIVPGDHLYGSVPFQEYIIVPNLENIKKIERFGSLPWSAYLGVCGMPGETAYYGYVAYVRPRVKAGDTLFVTTGAGPVGSLVIQLAKRDGLKVIGSAGSEEKVQFMKDCGADVAFNYKTTDTKAVLSEHGPINAYWDHVGGEVLDAALENAEDSAIFVECGLITGYNHGHAPIKNFKFVLFKNITVQGFIVGRLRNQYEKEFFQTIPALVDSGAIKYIEDKTRGLHAVGQVLLDQQLGKNLGKAVVVLADE